VENKAVCKDGIDIKDIMHYWRIAERTAIIQPFFNMAISKSK
jgi:hypothetical protein